MYYIYIPKYNLISPHNVACTYACFQSWPFGTRQPMGGLLLQAFLCHLELRPLGLFPIHFGASTVLFLFSSCWWDLTWHMSLTAGYSFCYYWEMQSPRKLPDFLALTDFLAPLLPCSLSLRCESVLLMKPLGLGPQPCIDWLVVVFCTGLHVFRREIFLMWGEDYTYLWI